jgi:hypothetical protein
MIELCHQIKSEPSADWFDILFDASPLLTEDSQSICKATLVKLNKIWNDDRVLAAARLEKGKKCALALASERLAA